MLFFMKIRRSGRQDSLAKIKEPLKSERMVRCEYCHVNVPEGESIQFANCNYCSLEHKNLAETKK